MFGWSHFPLLFVAGLDESGQIIKWKDGSSAPTSGAAASTSGDDMLSRMRDRNFRDLIYLINKPPRWNEQVGAYVLNFNGRVTMASVKNFQLVDPEEQNAVVLQVRQMLHHDPTPTLALLFLMCCSHSVFPLLVSLVAWARTSSRWICSGLSARTRPSRSR
jgi:hypothetical protein